jgi:hypothetical protein
MEIMADSFNNLTEHRNIMGGQNAELLVLNLVAPLDFKMSNRSLNFSVRHLNTIKSTADRSFLGIKPLPALQQM